jgi:S1-C subfamily serine protease
MEPVVDRLLEGRGFTVTKEPGGFGPSDHASFYAKKIPVLHLFTGSHEDYHRPTDTAEKINYEGMTRIVDFVADIVAELAATETPPEYVQVASTQFAGGGGDRPYFGSIPDFATSEEGYAISGVAKDSPAATGGLQGGDVIIRLGESAVKGLEDFDNALRKYRGGDTVTVVVRRGGMDVSLEVTLAAPR